MEGFSFYEGLLNAEDGYAFEPSLYNVAAHRRLQHDQGWYSYYVTNDYDKSIIAVIHFHLADGVARSPYRSPYGSIEMHPNVPPQVLFDFIRFFEIRLRSRGAKMIVIKHYPALYDEHASTLVETFLSSQGYSVSAAEISSVIEVTGDLAEDQFHSSEQKRLAKSVQAGLKFRELPPDRFDEVYAFIESCRSEKQYSLSMALQELGAVSREFPGKVALFGVFYQEEWAAASISIRVKQRTLYDFYHDHTARFDNLSPVVLLVAGIFDYCQRHQITRLDLGTSTLNTGLPNFGLMRFKRNLGAKFTHKRIYEKMLQ